MFRKGDILIADHLDIEEHRFTFLRYRRPPYHENCVLECAFRPLGEIYGGINVLYLFSSVGRNVLCETHGSRNF